MFNVCGWFDRLEEIEPRARDAAILEFMRQADASQKPLWTSLANSAFVPSESGSMHKAADLFDPRSGTLLALLDQDTRFPAKDYAAEEQVINTPIGALRAVDDSVGSFWKDPDSYRNLCQLPIHPCSKGNDFASS